MNDCCANHSVKLQLKQLSSLNCQVWVQMNMEVSRRHLCLIIHKESTSAQVIAKRCSLCPVPYRTLETLSTQNCRMEVSLSFVVKKMELYKLRDLLKDAWTPMGASLPSLSLVLLNLVRLQTSYFRRCNTSAAVMTLGKSLCLHDA